MTRLANAALFGNAGSLVLMVWGFIAWRRLPDGREWPALAAALIGAAILMGRSMEISPLTLLGDWFCLLAGLLYAGYLLRSEEHTSELQSLIRISYAVFCLNKNKRNNSDYTRTIL